MSGELIMEPSGHNTSSEITHPVLTSAYIYYYYIVNPLLSITLYDISPLTTAWTMKVKAEIHQKLAITRCVDHFKL